MIPFRDRGGSALNAWNIDERPNGGTSVEAKRQVRTDDQPTTRRREKLETLLREIRSDARERSPRYRDETLVPEGGE